MKKHYGFFEYLFCYILANLIIVIILGILLKAGANEDRLADLVNNHEKIVYFIQAYIAYCLTRF